MNIKKIRESQGLTAKDLAAHAGLPLRTLEKWEQGLTVPALDRLTILANVLDVSLDQLTGRSEEGESSGCESCKIA